MTQIHIPEFTVLIWVDGPPTEPGDYLVQAVPKSNTEELEIYRAYYYPEVGNTVSTVSADTRTVIKHTKFPDTLPYPHPRSRRLLETILTDPVVSNFPKIRPTMAWVGAVLDLLEGMGGASPIYHIAAGWNYNPLVAISNIHRPSDSYQIF